MIRFAAFLGFAVASIPAVAQPLPAIETVRACPQYGPGFFRLPGSSTCTRISGRITTDYTASARRASRDQVLGLGASGRVAVDSRTDTDYGPLRSYVRVKVRSGPGPER